MKGQLFVQPKTNDFRKAIHHLRDEIGQIDEMIEDEVASAATFRACLGMKPRPKILHEKITRDDGPQARVELLLPTPKPRRPRYPGCKLLDNRASLTGILFILKTSLPWNDLPSEMGVGSVAAFQAAPQS